VLSPEHKKIVNKSIENYLTEQEESLGFYPPLSGVGFCLSANGVPVFFLESEDSTVLLDLDETLLRVYRINPELIEFLRKNPGADDIRPEKGKFQDRKEIAKFANENLDAFNEVLENYKHKSSVKVVPHKVFGHVAVVFRPGIVELLNGLEQMIGSKDLKDVKIFTANQLWWAEALKDALNDYTGKKTELYDLAPLTDDSKLIDDQEGSAKIKLFKSKVIDNIMDDISGAWVPVEPFKGNMNDRELFKVLGELENMDRL
jgi:hypothetical protein